MDLILKQRAICSLVLSFFLTACGGGGSAAPVGCRCSNGNVTPAGSGSRTWRWLEEPTVLLTKALASRLIGGSVKRRLCLIPGLLRRQHSYCRHHVAIGLQRPRRCHWQATCSSRVACRKGLRMMLPDPMAEEGVAPRLARRREDAAWDARDKWES